MNLDTFPPSFPRICTDGGLLSANPSDRGGSWAWLRIEHDEIVSHASGWVRATDMPEGTVSSNQMEFLAVLRAFQSLEDGEIVVVISDSDVTLSRWTGDGRFGYAGIPDEWRRGMNDELRRCGGLFWHQIAGHPAVRPSPVDGLTDLERGRKLKRDGSAGLPVSKWNIEADRLCTEQANLGNLVLRIEAEAHTNIRISEGA